MREAHGPAREIRFKMRFMNKPFYNNVQVWTKLNLRKRRFEEFFSQFRYPARIRWAGDINFSQSLFLFIRALVVQHVLR